MRVCQLFSLPVGKNPQKTHLGGSATTPRNQGNITGIRENGLELRISRGRNCKSDTGVFGIGNHEWDWFPRVTEQNEP
jgi:hypothetical protein